MAETSRRDAAVGANAGHHRRGGAVARARHRRQHRDLLADRFPAPQVTAGPRSGSSRPHRRGELSHARHSGLQADRRRRTCSTARRRCRCCGRTSPNTPERRSAFGIAVNGGFFDTLGVTPAIGRLLTPEDDQPGTPAVAVTDYEFWQTEYGGRPDILGATIRLDGKPFTIVGVTERGFFGLNVGRRFDVAIALNGYRTLYPDSIDGISNSFAIVGRLKPGQTVGRGGSGAARVATRHPCGVAAARQRAPLAQPGHRSSRSRPASSTTTQEQYARPLTVLMALVALVLLIACTNVANLLIARGSARRGELAVRLSLGATRGQVLRSLADREPGHRARERRGGGDRRLVDRAGNRQRGRGQPERRIRQLDRRAARLSG